MNVVWTDQRSTEGRISTAVAEDFAPSATATATEGSFGRRPKFLSTVVTNLKLSFEIDKIIFRDFFLKIFELWSEILPSVDY